MKYLKTKNATNWSKEKSWKENLINRVLFFIPESNPDYEDKIACFLTQFFVTKCI